jgi:hypothetical protein
MNPVEFGKIGSVRVTFYRAKAVLRSEPWVDDGRFSVILDEVPEQAAKGADLKANTK